MKTVFRAWLKYKKKMIKIQKIDFERLYFYYDKSSFCTQHDIELMQLTGLEDENNEGIHEGDIIRDCLDNTYIVSFESGGFVATTNDGATPCEIDLSELASESQIIGNIYDNPDLLVE